MFRTSIAKPAPQPKVRIPVKDRVANSEAMVLGFLAEKNLTFSDAPDLIQLAKTLATDSEALAELSIDRTAASYKMKFGVGKTFADELTTNLRKNFFSLNIDEATSKSSKKVLSFLVSYFSAEDGKVVVKHLHSTGVIKATSEAIHDELKQVFKDKELPWTNLMSILMDSCNVMRGSKSGFETRVRSSDAPHLLDIDGDSCHHAHNASKRISDNFEKFVEHMFWCIHTDFHWSPDLVEALREICFLLGVSYTMPERYVPTRWLTVYDVSMDALRLLDAYTVFYYSFLPSADRVTFLRHCVEIYARLNLSPQVKDRIRDIQGQLSRKNMTAQGKDRKKKVTQRMFYERKRMMLVLHFYSCSFPLLKRYTVLFQTKEPMLHKVNDEQTALLKEFLTCFVRPDLLLDASARKLSKLDLAAPGNWLPDKDMYVGLSARKLCNKQDSAVVDFMKSVRKAYVDCGSYLQMKMPVTNKLLTHVSALDPVVRGEPKALQYMLALPTLVTNVLTEDEQNSYDMEVRKFHVDGALPKAATHSRLDSWWAAVFATGNYPSLAKLVAALMSCFHGPQVEGSFSQMANIMNTATARMNVSTFNSIQTVKYALMASSKTAIQYFHKHDHLHEPVNSQLVHNMRGAYKMYSSQLADDRKLQEEKKVALNMSKQKAATKRKAKECAELATKKARMAHQRAVLKKLVKKRAANSASAQHWFSLDYAVTCQ